MNSDQEYKLMFEATRGQRAAELMADELIVEAFDTLNERLTNEWANSPVRDSEGRERIWLMQKLLKSVGDHLNEIATTGKMATLQLAQERTIVERAKQWAQEIF